MADTKTSALPDAGALTGTEIVPIVQSGNNRKLTLAALLTWITTSLSAALRLIPAGGNPGEVLQKASSTDYDATWSSAWLVPAGSVAGYVLTQRSGTAGDYGFEPSAAGSPGAIQHNNGTGGLAGAANAGIGASGSLELTVDTAPTVPAVGKMTFYAAAPGGRVTPAWRAPVGRALPVQPSLAHTRIGHIAALGGGTTVFSAVGMPGATAIGTNAGVNVGTANALTAARRIRNVSSAGAGSSAGYRFATAIAFTDASGSSGGFYISMRFGEATIVTDSRAFAGILASAAAIGNVDPSTLVSLVGMGYDSGESTWSIIHNDPSGTAQKIALGSDYPANTSDEAYEVTIWAPSGQGSIWVEVWRLGTTHRVTHELTTEIPASPTLLAPQVWVNNGPTASAKSVDFMQLYVETNN